MIKNRVKDAGNFTVSVAVKDLRLLPSDMQSMICERREALKKGDGSRASELLKQINSSRDYEYLHCSCLIFSGKVCEKRFLIMRLLVVTG